jgi:hypothetical protein
VYMYVRKCVCMYVWISYGYHNKEPLFPGSLNGLVLRHRDVMCFLCSKNFVYLNFMLHMVTSVKHLGILYRSVLHNGISQAYTVRCISVSCRVSLYHITGHFYPLLTNLLAKFTCEGDEEFLKIH